MKHKRFSDEQVVGVLKEHEAGAKVDDVCRRHAISTATFCAWRKKHGGMEAGDGPEGTSRAMFDRSERTGVRLRFIEPGKPVRDAPSSRA